jgi:large subunit ribosomal protein L17
MRHGKKNNHLGRTDSHRKAMLANMASSLIKHKRISTTLAKAKALRMYVEPLITKSKNDTTHSRRIVFGYLKDKETVTELFRDIATKVASRPGGYTRIIKLNNRLGDNAEMALIELVDYNEVYGKEVELIELVDYNEIYGVETPTEEKKTTRRGRSKAKKSDAPVEEAVVVEDKVEEAPAVEEAPGTEESKEDKGV